MSITSCHADCFMRMTRPSFVIPALLIRTSTVPYSSVAALNIAWISLGSPPLILMILFCFALGWLCCFVFCVFKVYE